MAEAMVLTTKELTNRPVVAARGKKNRDRRIGKVRRFVFHPSERRLIGVIAKRPDIALMFHRKDLFVALDSFKYIDGELHVEDEDKGTGTAAIRRLGVSWDKCVLWLGMQMVTENGTMLGRVGDVMFDAETGKVQNVLLNEGATSRALLGTTTIPASLIKGFRWGVGDALRPEDEEILDDENATESWADRGAILLSDDALNLAPEGGLAEAAAKSSVVAVAKTKQAAASVKDQAISAVGSLKPKAANVAEAAKPKVAEAATKAAEKTGEHLAGTKTMFSDFVQEYRKASGSADSAEETGNVDEAGNADEAAADSEVPPSVSGEEAKDNVAAEAAKSVKKRTKTMFSGFMDEYRKALEDDE